MVDHAIMTLTGTGIRAEAYEALFPERPTASTTIMLKYNEGTGGQASLISYPAVKNAVRTGLTSMLGGKFPAANIREFNKNDSAASDNPQFAIGSNMYHVKNSFMANTYFINIPVCWATTSGMAGVTMSMKSMMSAVAGNLSAFHANFTNASTPALSMLNSQAVFRQKQVLVLMDAIQINSASGPTTPPNGQAFSIIASKDMVAADYQGMLILKGKGLPSDRETAAKTVFDLASKAPYPIGVSDPANMEVINISAPWTTGVVWRSRSAAEMGLQVHSGTRNGKPHIIFGLNDRYGKPIELSIFNAQGAKIWSSPGLEWNGETTTGDSIGYGPFMYSLKAGDRMVRGQIIPRLK